MFNIAPKCKFITTGEKKCEVTLWINGHKITRRREGSHNSYICDGKLYSAVRAEVPDAIQSIIRCSLLTYQRQIDSHLWIHSSPGEVAKKLNEIVDLEIIDATLTNLSKRERRQKATVGVLESSLREAKEKKKKARAGLAMALDFEHVQQSYQAACNAETQWGLLNDALAAEEALAKHAQQCNRRALAASVATGLCKQTLSLDSHVKRLSGAIARIEELDRLKPVKIAGLEVIEHEYCKWKGLNAECSKLHKMIVQASVLDFDIKGKKDTWRLAERRLTKIKICPTCKRPL